MTQLSLLEPADPWGLIPEGSDPDGLRWYQREAVDAVMRSLEEHRSALVVAATGTGKTQIFSALAKAWPGSVLVLAHRDELVQQARDRLEQVTGERVDVEQADLEASSKARIVVGSVDTVKQPRRLARMGKERFSLVVVDEAHHYPSRTYRRPIDWFEAAKVVGVTATPDRKDRKALGRLFEDVAYTFDICRGIHQGYLVPLRGRRVVLEGVDLDSIAKTAGDLQANQLDEAMLESIEAVVQKTLELEPDRQGIAFFPGVKTAELAAERFNAAVPGSAVFISGATPREERRAIVEGFRAGKYKYLCNCQVATEGFDAPTASLIIQARPTLSRALYAQMVGRGTRVLPGTVEHLEGPLSGEARRAAIAGSAKPDCMILDFVGNSTRHDLATPEDLLGGSYTDEEVQAAKKLAEAEPGSDTIENLKSARAQLKALAASMRGTVRARTEAFDPFTAMGLVLKPDERFNRYRPQATDGQKNFLRAKGVDDATLNGLTRIAAVHMMNEMVNRSRKGLCTYKQLRTLAKHGIDGVGVSFDSARKALDYLASRGWGRYTVDASHLRSLIQEGPK